MRFIGIALCISLVVVIGATLVGRAVDAAVRERVIIARAGMTLDCERYVASQGEIVSFEDGSSVKAFDGEVFYRNCVRVP